MQDDGTSYRVSIYILEFAEVTFVSVLRVKWCISMFLRLSQWLCTDNSNEYAARIMNTCCIGTQRYESESAIASWMGW